MRKFLAVVCIASGTVMVCAAVGAKSLPLFAAALFYFGAARHWLRTA